MRGREKHKTGRKKRLTIQGEKQDNRRCNERKGETQNRKEEKTNDLRREARQQEEDRCAQVKVR